MKTRSVLKRVIVVLCVFLCAEIGLFVFWIHSGTSAYARNLDLGNKYLLSEDYDSAISAFSKAIEIDAMNADAYIGRGDAYKAKGDYESAWEDYEKAEELSGRNDVIAGKFPERSIHVAALDGTPLSGAEVFLESDEHSYSLQTDISGNASGIMFPTTYSVTVRRSDREESAQTYMTTVTFNSLEDNIKDIIIDSVEDYPYEVGDNVWAKIENINGSKTLLFYSLNGTLSKDWKKNVGFKNIETITAIGFSAGSEKMYLPKDSSYLFSNQENYSDYKMDNLQKIDTSKMDTSRVTNMMGMFCESDGLVELDLSGFNTKKVTDMAIMFCHCENLTKLNLHNFNTSNVTTMASMFRYCRKLTNLDVSSFNTAKVTDMGYMFAACNSLVALDFKNFNTSNVTNMADMFLACFALKSVNVSSFDTSKVTGMVYMFNDCYNLASLDLSNFDTSKVDSFYNMFGHCESLKKLDLSSFNTSNATAMVYMFGGCSSLQELNLSSFDMSKVTEADNMFKNCNELQILRTPKNSIGWVELPIVMYDSEGTQYSSLPTLSESFVLAKTYIDERSESSSD